jgi:hypothetical protein
MRASTYDSGGESGHSQRRTTSAAADPVSIKRIERSVEDVSSMLSARTAIAVANIASPETVAARRIR